MVKILFEQIDRVMLFNKLVKEQRTGTPDEIANRLGLKRSSFFRFLEELKEREVPIAYSKCLCSYYYTRPFEIEIVFSLKPLDHEEQIKVEAGSVFFSESTFYGRNYGNFATA